jgi:hypothetical protein
MTKEADKKIEALLAKIRQEAKVTFVGDGEPDVLVEEIAEDRIGDIVALTSDLLWIQRDALELGYKVDAAARGYPAKYPVRFALKDATHNLEEANAALDQARIGLDRAWRELVAAGYAEEAKGYIDPQVNPGRLTPEEAAIKAILHSPAGAMAWLQERDPGTYELIRRVTAAHREAQELGRDPRGGEDHGI